MDWVASLMNVTSMTTLLSLSNLIFSSSSFREKNKALRRIGRRASERLRRRGGISTTIAVGILHCPWISEGVTGDCSTAETRAVWRRFGCDRSERERERERERENGVNVAARGQ